MDDLNTSLLQLECHFTWGLRREDFNLQDLVNRLNEQIRLESGEARVTRAYSSLAFVSYLYDDLQSALGNLLEAENIAKKYYGEYSDKFLIVTYGDLAWLWYHMKHFTVAEDYLRKVQKINEKYSEESNQIRSEVLKEKGWAFLKFSRKYYNGARECFRQALGNNPEDSDLNTGYAIALYRTTMDSESSQTVEQLQRAVQLNPKDAVLYVLLALRLINTNQGPINPKYTMSDSVHLSPTRKAISLVVKALEIAPENPYVLRYVAQFSRKLGSADFAICNLEKALSHTSDSAFMHHQLALCYKSKKILFEKANGPCYKSDQSETKNCLRKCIYHLECAVSLKPSFIFALTELAEIYGQMKQIPKSEMHFQKAFQLANEQKEHLQTVHARYGKFQLYSKGSEQLAIYHYMQGLRLQVDSSEGRKCEEALKQIANFRFAKAENDSKACTIKGFIHELRGEKKLAEMCYERALTEGGGIGESPLLTELRVWLLTFKGAEHSARNAILGTSFHEEKPNVSGRPTILKGKMDKKAVHVVEIDLCNAKSILTKENSVITPGPHAIVFAFVHDGQLTEETQRILGDLESFGKNFWKHVIVIFTNKDTCIRGQEGVVHWLLSKCEYRYYITGRCKQMTQTKELSERIQKMLLGNKNMHLVISREQSFLQMVKRSEREKGSLFTPTFINMKGQSKYRFLCKHAGWYFCTFTHLGFKMKGEGEVLYTTLYQDSNCPLSSNYYPAGPLYDIKCVQGELSQIQLPHCEESPEDDYNFMIVAQYTDHRWEIMKPESITPLRVCVSVPTTSWFQLKDILNRFKRKIRGQIILMYHPPPKHMLHVYLRPWNVDPKTGRGGSRAYLESLGARQEYTMEGVPVLHRATHKLTHSLTPTDTFESPIHLPTCVFGLLGGNRSTRRKPTRTRGEHTTLVTDSHLDGDSNPQPPGPWSCVTATLPAAPPCRPLFQKVSN
ncbi:interferon-induced protein with tetratricopeptide repeats 5 isoform X2 [Hoplias malabaricus]|uniref:interferon-induced protein with tetratricopeptide repeats 5 isoform X2 n=1 Tax=Hoplias malabaricus TaxID=27720 RepID=UPI0034632401